MPTTEVSRATPLVADFGGGTAYEGVTTVGYTVYDTAGVVHVARTTSGVVNRDLGTYVASFTPGTVGAYLVWWDTVSGGSVYAAEHLTVLPQALGTADYTAARAAKLDNLDATVSSRAAAGAAITVANPGAADKSVTVVKGDDYSAVDSRHLAWTTTAAGDWPTLTGGTAITLTVTNRGTALLAVTGGSIITATGAAKQVGIDLTAAQTGGLTAGAVYRYDLQIMISGRKVTLARGTFTTQREETA